jgi:CheY-specific phosphatase CheX
MPQIDMQQIFLQSTSEVLETMFFTGIVEEHGEEPDSSMISAELTFEGSPSGQFGVRMPQATARAIAASFLGSDDLEITDSQVADVVCELANMLCGSVLSRLEAGARFELLHPEIDPSNRPWTQVPEAVGYTFGLDEGAITLWIATKVRVPALAQ